MLEMYNGQFQFVYNKIVSFSLASMMATTLFLWMKVPPATAKYQTGLIISGLVTFIAACHYFRIFNSWAKSFVYTLKAEDPQLTGIPFNDAYRYMGWLLTVPMLLIVLVMQLTAGEASTSCVNLGGSILGYPGYIIVEGDLSQRWQYWALAMLPPLLHRL